MLGTFLTNVIVISYSPLNVRVDNSSRSFLLDFSDIEYSPKQD